MAGRLAENLNVNVLLLEAGGDDDVADVMRPNDGYSTLALIGFGTDRAGLARCPTPTGLVNLSAPQASRMRVGM